MSDPDPGVDARLRRAFAALGDEQPRAEGCPAPEVLWDAANGHAKPDAVAAIVDHLLGCGSCAAEWRLAVALEPGSAHEPASADLGTTERGLTGTIDVAGVVPIQRRSRRATYLAAAGAALALAAGLVLYARATRPSTAPGWRSPDEGEVRLQVADGQVLPRDAFILRWEPAGVGASYAVFVSTADLRDVARGLGLSGTTFQVPASALVALPAGARLSWRVEATLPDGTTRTSRTRWARLP